MEMQGRNCLRVCQTYVKECGDAQKEHTDGQQKGCISVKPVPEGLQYPRAIKYRSCGGLPERGENRQGGIPEEHLSGARKTFHRSDGSGAEYFFRVYFFPDTGLSNHSVRRFHQRNQLWRPEILRVLKFWTYPGTVHGLRKFPRT